MAALLSALKVRIETSCARLGLSYPWWIPAYSTFACVLLTVIAYAQRDALHPTPAVLVGGLLTIAPLGLWVVSTWMLPPVAEAAITTAGVALYLTDPASPDFAPLLLLIVAGEAAATARPLIALVVAAADAAVLVVASQVGHLQSTPLYVVGVILGADVGIVLRWQMRALAAERANTTIERQRARLDERARIAREVHDIVGHSLSISLLHVTAARHALQQHADIPDAVESLAEAEQVGRAAMGDLRRTVTVLGSAGDDGTPDLHPLPGFDDLPELIARSCAAGLDVRFDCEVGDPPLGATAGLGVYRIVQESLANVAKHAPTAQVQIRLAAGPDTVRLSVRNTLPSGRGDRSGRGAGLAGMAARARQMDGVLHAGPDGDCWLVDLTVPGASV